jgi:hypothetical protein
MKETIRQTLRENLIISEDNINENDPKVGTGKKPKGSDRRLYTDENPNDTVSVKFRTKQDIIDTLNKESFKSKSHARKSQIINLIHQRLRVALERAKEPEVKKRLKTAFDYIETKKEQSKKKTEEMKEGELNERCWKGYTQKGMKTMFGKRYPNCVKKTKESFQIENNVINEITSDEAWEKVYSNTKNFPYLKGNKEIFDKLDNLYPKKGNQFNKGYFGFLYNLLKTNELKDEDFYKAKQYLELFDRNFGKLPKDKRNITQFKNLPDLFDAISGFEKTEGEPESKTQELKAIKEKEIERVYEDSQWKVLVPKTERASCLIGKGTQWCTAADRSNNMFDNYNKRGKLYVLINKDDDSKYQIHFEDEQLMDSRDRPISGAYFFEYVVEDGELVDWFEKNIPNFYDFILATSAEDISSGGYYELFNEALNNGSEDAVREALDILRGGSDESSVADGFLYEKDPYFIKDYQIENYIENFNDTEMFPRVIEHLKEIGVDFDDINDGSVKVLLKGLDDLKKHKLEIDKEYKIDKKRKLRIISVDAEKDYPRYRIKINGTDGLVPIDSLLSYLSNRFLFETKEFIKKNLRKVLTPSNFELHEAAKGLNDLPDDIGLFVSDNGTWLNFTLYSKSENKIYGVITTSDINGSNKLQEVGRVAAEKGYGPLMYEIAMGYINPGYLMPTRDGDIRSEAWNVWKKFYGRKDIVKKTLGAKDDLFSFVITTGDNHEEFDSPEEKQEMFDELPNYDKETVTIFNTMYQYSNPMILKLIYRADEQIKNGEVDIRNLKHTAAEYFSQKYA